MPHVVSRRVRGARPPQFFPHPVAFGLMVAAPMCALLEYERAEGADDGDEGGPISTRRSLSW
ncbi:hypothetical protein [Streptomyces sp. NPDC050416]|uniref:hypothetical protein n=1 Tax=Streptomyces sp. NPDC050416 TaxID=3365611 RepID=UPI0037AC4D92